MYQSQSARAGIEGTRLEAQEITRVLPAAEDLAYGIFYGLKAAVVIAFLIFGSWAGTRLGFSSWFKDLFLWSVAIFLVVLPPNTQALLWLLSELQRGNWNITRFQPSSRGPERPTSPKSIEVGDYIRSVEDSKAATSHQGPLTYYRVIVKLTTPDSGRVRIGVFGHKWYDTDPAEPSNRFIRLEAPVPGRANAPSAQAADIARALGNLIELLFSENKQRMRENILASRLTKQFDHDQQSVRLAFRIAESGMLISRMHLSGYVAEQLKIFRRKAVIAGHENCGILLTETGRMWQLAGSDYRKIDHPKSAGVVMGDYIVNQGVAGSMGRENVVQANISNPSWGSPQAGDIKDLAEQLAKLRVELRKHSTSPGQDLAIADVASALLSAEEGDAAGAVDKINKLGSHAATIRKWIIDTATEIGVPLVVAVIKQSWLHMPPGG